MGLPAGQIKKACLAEGTRHAKIEQHYDYVIFGDLAVVTTSCVVLDPWLCVPAFRRVCYYRDVDKVQLHQRPKCYHTP